jgi:hypothetical protein
MYSRPGLAEDIMSNISAYVSVAKEMLKYYDSVALNEERVVEQKRQNGKKKNKKRRKNNGALPSPAVAPRIPS